VPKFAKLNGLPQEALKTKGLQDPFRYWRFDMSAESTPEFTARLNRELGRWGWSWSPIVKATGFTAME